MSVMDMFRNVMGGASATPAAPASGTGNPGNIPEGTGVAPAGNPTAPATPAAAAPETTKSPLDAFEKIWENDPNAASSSDKFSFNVDPKKLQEAAGKTNFAGILNQETMAKIAAGGEDAVGAFQDSLNKVAQQVYAQSAFASTKMIEAAISKAQESFESRIPSLVKKYQVSDSIRTKNDALSHPAAAPIVSAMEHQLAQKYPDATASELTAMAEQFLDSFATAVNSTKQAATEETTKGSKADTDWSTFL